MKKKMFAIIATGALAPGALTQGAWQFELVGGVGTEANPLRPGQASATVRLSIAPPPGEWGLSRVYWFTHAEEEGWSNPLQLHTHIGDPGEVSGSMVGECYLAQIGAPHCTGFFPYPGQLDLWEATFTVTDFDQREIGLWTETSRYEVFPSDPCYGGGGWPGVPRDVVEGQASLFVVPTPLCYADCDGSGSLDFFDFLCFQAAFAAGDPYADCDGSGAIDLFDFLCFQEAFAAGCP